MKNLTEFDEYKKKQNLKNTKNMVDSGFSLLEQEDYIQL